LQQFTLASLPFTGGRLHAGVEQKVRQIIADHLGLEVSDIADKSAFAEDLGADSLDRVDFPVSKR